MLNGEDFRVQRSIRHMYKYLSTDPAIPIEERVTIQTDSHLHWFLKAISIGVFTELMENANADSDPLIIDLGSPPDPVLLPPIPDDPEAI